MWYHVEGTEYQIKKALHSFRRQKISVVQDGRFSSYIYVGDSHSWTGDVSKDFGINSSGIGSFI